MLKAGAAKVNITPPVGGPMAGYSSREGGSLSVHDELHAAALVLHDGQTTLALIPADLLGISTELSTEVRARLGTRLGLAPEQIMIAGTHTHWGPEIRGYRIRNGEDTSPAHLAYLEVLTGKLASVAVSAHEALRPAKIGAARTTVEGLAYNRRPLRKADGSCCMAFRLPPDEPLETLTFGATDPELGVLRVVEAGAGGQDGATIASLLNFASHPVSSTDKMGALGADWPGYAVRLVEEQLGGVAMFGLGCAGNQVPIRREGDWPRRLGVSLGGAALTPLLLAETGTEFKLAAARKKVDLPLRDLEADVASQKMRPVFAHLQGRTSLAAEVQAWRLGETPVIALPGEIFVESGLDLKARLGCAPSILISMANEALGYFPLRRSYEEGGYEPLMSPFAPGATETLIDAAFELAKSL